MSSSTAKKKMDQGMARIREIRKTPLVITAIFLELLRSHFGNNSVQFKWDEDSVDTKLIIEPIHKLNFSEVQKRPAVYVARGPFQYATSRLAIDDQSGTNRATGRKCQMVLVSCPVQLIPVGRNMGEVERLAEEVSEVVLVFKSLIRQDYQFTRFDLAGIAPLGVVQEDREYFTAPLTVNTQFTEAWAIEPFAAKLRAVTTHIRAKLVGLVDKDNEECLTVVKPEPRAYSPELDPSDPCPPEEFCPLPPDDLRGQDEEETDTSLGDGYGEGDYA